MAYFFKPPMPQVVQTFRIPDRNTDHPARGRRRAILASAASPENPNAASAFATHAVEQV
jgi:hypothetical protein